MKTLKSIGAVLAGLILIFALSHLTDVVMEKTGVMLNPFHKNPLWVMLFVTAYRLIFVAAGTYLAAVLAPGKPMLHAMILGTIGCVLGILGAIAMWDHPPHWYPVSLVILGWPFAWLGGKLKTK
jgi:hypothetical protein